MRAPRIKRECQHDGRHKHGTPVAYTHDRCRCEECTEAIRVDHLIAYRRRGYGITPLWVPVHRVTRRLQALARLGYNDAELARQLDWKSRKHVRLLLLNEVGEKVGVDLFANVDRVYMRLSGTPAFGREATRAKNRAIRNGWVSPQAWDDIDNDPEPADLSHLQRMVAS